MKTKFLPRIALCAIVFSASNCFADLAGRIYDKEIIIVEEMLDQAIAMDEKYIQATLKNLKENTTSKDRLERIQSAQDRFNNYLQARHKIQPRVTPQQAAQIIQRDEEDDDEKEGRELPVQAGVVPGAPLPPAPTPAPSVPALQPGTVLPATPLPEPSAPPLYPAQQPEPVAPFHAVIPDEPMRPRLTPKNPFEEQPTPTPASVPTVSSSAPTPKPTAGSGGQAETDQQAKIGAAQARVSRLEKAVRDAIKILAKYDDKKSLEWNEIEQFAQEIDAADKLASTYLVALDNAEESLLDPKNNEKSKQLILNAMAFYQKLYDGLTAPGSASKKEREEVPAQQEDSIIKQLQALLDAANTLEQSDPITKTVFNNATKLANKTFVPLLDRIDEDRRKNTLIVVTKLAINSVKKDADSDNIVKQTKSVIKTIKDLAQHLIKEAQEKNSLQQLQKALADDAKSDTNDIKKLLDESAHYRDLSYEIFKAGLIKKDAFETWNKTYQQITQARQNLNTKNPQSKEYKDAIQQLKKATSALKKLVDARIDEIAQEKRR